MATRKAAPIEPAPKKKSRSGPSGPSGANKQAGLLLRADPVRRHAWQAAADRAGTNLSEWLREAADEKALRDRKK